MRWLLAVLLFSSSPVLSLDLNKIMIKANSLSFDKRIDFYTQVLLGAVYDGGPLGEGEQGLYDQDPLYHFSRFDCTTFVETVVALAMTNNKGDFEYLLNEIRYKDGVTQFITRNHFISLDWIINNSQLFQDITSEVGRGNTLVARTIINKKGWYQKKKDSDLKLITELTKEERAERLESLRAEGEVYEEVEVETPYIPLSKLYQNERVDLDLINRIPNGSIISMVRPDWNLRNAIGTNLNVSHQAIAIWKNGELKLRHASTKGSVREESFIDYFKRYVDSKTLKGFNVLKVD